MAISTINPATGETVRTFAPHDDAGIERVLQSAVTAFQRHRQTTMAERASRMRACADLLDARQDSLAALMTVEMGKPRKAGVEEAIKCAWGCRFYADNAERFLADEPAPSNASRSWIAYQPLGVILAIMPWNFPLWQVFRFAAPALMAGNVGLLKHASNVPQCALAIEALLREAGFAEGVFQTLLVGSDRVAGLLADDRVAAATLTGSESAGRSVAMEAGRHLKKTVLELGGSDPFVVLPSADVAAAARVAATARTINNGQSCIAAKRFIVHERIAETFETAFVAAMRALRVGDPMDDATQIGPLATSQIRDELHAQVRATVKAGAKLALGGEPLAGRGFYYPPTVLTQVPRESPAAREELFGPVAPVFRVRDLDEAIALANDTPFGLAASAWTSEPREQDALVERIEAGAVFLNGMVVSDPRLPFGGMKRSGYGRELGMFGIREFVNVKTVWARDAGTGAVHATTE